MKTYIIHIQYTTKKNFTVRDRVYSVRDVSEEKAVEKAKNIIHPLYKNTSKIISVNY